MWKVDKMFKKTGKACSTHDQGRKWTVWKKKQLVKNTTEKLWRSPRWSVAKLDTEAGVSEISMCRVLKNNFQTFAYKMQKKHELANIHDHTRLERY